MSMQNWTVDENYIPTLGIKISAGKKFFTCNFLQIQQVLSSMKLLQNFLATKNLLNKKLYTIKDIQQRQLSEYHIIGVVKNFNFSSLRDVITPLAFFLGNR